MILASVCHNTFALQTTDCKRHTHMARVYVRTQWYWTMVNFQMLLTYAVPDSWVTVLACVSPIMRLRCSSGRHWPTHTLYDSVYAKVIYLSLSYKQSLWTIETRQAMKQAYLPIAATREYSLCRTTQWTILHWAPDSAAVALATAKKKLLLDWLWNSTGADKLTDYRRAHCTVS